MHACLLGNRTYVSTLLSYNADLTIEDEDKCNCLHMAAREGHCEVIDELMEAGAKVDPLDIGQWTPLIWACYRGKTEAVKLLISHQANVHSRGLHQVRVTRAIKVTDKKGWYYKQGTYIVPI